MVVGPEQFKPTSSSYGKLTDLLRSEEWEVAILTGRHPDARREALARASGARLRLGPGHDKAFPNLNLEPRAPVERDYPYQRTATWGRVLGVPLDDTPLRWPLVEEMDRQMAQLVHFNKPRKDQLLVGVDPGVGKEGIALAPENLAFLVNHLASHVRSKTILLTSELGTRCDDLGKLLRCEQLDLPRPTLKETVLLLAQCDLFLAANTDLLHYAVAMDVPTLGIFTARDRANWVPTDASNLAILDSVEGESLSLADLMDQVDELLR
ncbi:MAG: glycosyltransferase family 9 protein [Gemmatimonadetes bacterium]|nr:glycosyltransferase family 9 protein [Gemmatimonadota bacterium]